MIFLTCQKFVMKQIACELHTTIILLLLLCVSAFSLFIQLLCAPLHLPITARSSQIHQPFSLRVITIATSVWTPWGTYCILLLLLRTDALRSQNLPLEFKCQSATVFFHTLSSAVRNFIFTSFACLS